MSNLNFTGDWFIAGGKKYPGTLEVNEQTGQVLLEVYSGENLEGQKNSITHNTSALFHEFIFADGHGGPFTLYRCSLKNCSLIGREFYKTVYQAEYLIYGVTIKSQELLVRSGSFEFPGLADWYDGWVHMNQLSDLEGKLTDLSLSKSETLKVNDELELIFTDSIRSRIEEISFSYLVSYSKTLTFSYSVDVPFKRMLKDAVTFQKLLEFSNSKPLHRNLFAVTISHEHVVEDHHRHFNREFERYNISNFSLNKNKPVPKHGSHSAHMIFSNGKLSKTELNAIIIKWFDLAAYQNIIEYYLDSNNWFSDSKDAVLSNVMFNNRFLNLVQGLEDYYRVNHHTVNDEQVFNGKKAAVLAQITDPQLKQWLNNTFKFTRYLRLEEKLTIIVDEFLPVIQQIYGTITFGEFPRSAKDFRNDLSHGMNNAVSLGDRLHLDYHISQLLLLLCILKGLGIQDIPKLLKGHFKLQHKIKEILLLQQKYPS